MRLHPLLCAVFFAALFATPVHAACIYNGKLDVRTTVRQEFNDSRWVVRARVISAVDCWGEGACRDPDAPFTVYRLRVVHSYKGKLESPFRFFTERNSGGFYMDRAWVKLPQGHDIGGEYLLFLVPSIWSPSHRAARGTVFVNYPCGQSGPWPKVSKSARQLLDRLAERDQRASN